MLDISKVGIGTACAALLLLGGCSGVPGSAGVDCLRRVEDAPLLVDLEGNEVPALDADGAKASVFLFTRSDCPISNRYAPEVRRIAETFGPRGVRFRLVYLDRSQPGEAIRAHIEEYGYPFDAFKDPAHELVKLTGASVTPEAAVFLPGGCLVYRGRIDDRWVDFGKARAAATRHDLELALESALAGRPVEQPETKAVGCFIPDLR